MRRAGIEHDGLQLALREINRKRCRPLLTEHEVDAITNSVVTRYRPAPEVEEPPLPDDEAPPHDSPLYDGGPESSETGSVSAEPVHFSGDALLALLTRPAPDPIHAGIAPPGHLCVTVGPSFGSKSAVLYWVMMARAAGAAPWEGSPALEPGHVLILSPDEAAEQVVRRMDHLARQHPAGPLEGYKDRLHVLGPDHTLPPEALDWLQFGRAGIAQLDRWLTLAEQAGRPFVYVGCDAYSDLLPDGAKENDNDQARQIGRALEHLAVRHGCAIHALAHTGKPNQNQDVVDLRFLMRGASAAAAKARTVFGIDVPEDAPNTRCITSISNLGKTPEPLHLAVCDDPNDSRSVHYLRVIEAPKPSEERPEKYLKPDEEIPTRELARRLLPKGKRKITGQETDLATHLRERWRKAGLVTVRDGPRSAKLISLPSRPTPDAQTQPEAEPMTEPETQPAIVSEGLV